MADFKGAGGAATGAVTDMNLQEETSKMRNQAKALETQVIRTRELTTANPVNKAIRRSHITAFANNP